MYDGQAGRRGVRDDAGTTAMANDILILASPDTLQRAGNKPLTVGNAWLAKHYIESYPRTDNWNTGVWGKSTNDPTAHTQVEPH